jgi:hypothetical protein
MAPRGGCRSYLLRRNLRVPGTGRIAAGDGGGTPVTRGQRLRRRRGVAGREGVSQPPEPYGPSSGTATALMKAAGGRGWVAATDSSRAVRKAGRKANESVRWRGALFFPFGRGEGGRRLRLSARVRDGNSATGI